MNPGSAQNMCTNVKKKKKSMGKRALAKCVSPGGSFDRTELSGCPQSDLGIVPSLDAPDLSG